METGNRNREQSPFDKLKADKARLKEVIKISEQNLGKDLLYIRDNSVNLMISGFTSALFSPGKPRKEQEPPALSSGGNMQGKSLKFSDYWAIGRGMAPIVWDIVQPFVVVWGINAAKSLIGGIFARRHKKALRA
ncbi:MAG: hypothetical protein LBE91_00525 [Tannerella sp.]|jgi:hypothetical protein|nr:hypothetical protein [Tannerella sp.]